MCKTCDLILIRHEEVEGNLALVKSFSGDTSGFTKDVIEQPSSEWRLTPNGQHESPRLGNWLRDTLEDFNGFKFAVSPIRRAKETAILALPEVSWENNYSLRGRIWGGIESVPRREWLDYCIKRGIDHLPSGFREAYPDGETMSEVWERTLSFLRDLQQKTVVVTHGEVVQMFRMIIEAIPESSYHDLDRNGNYIRNGQIVWYSKRDPNTGECSSSFRFKRIRFRDKDTGWLILPAG